VPWSSRRPRAKVTGQAAARNLCEHWIESGITRASRLLAAHILPSGRAPKSTSTN